MKRYTQCIGLLVLFNLLGCATLKTAESKPRSPSTPTAVDQLLVQAAAEFKGPNAPDAIHVLDQTEAQWNMDRSLKITVHQIWATRVTPSRTLPPLATVNHDSQDFKLITLQVYHLNDQGQFNPFPTQAVLNWKTPVPNLPPTLSHIDTAYLPELKAGEALEVKYTLQTKNVDLLNGKNIHFDANHLQPVPAEPSFALLWNDYLPSIKKELTIKVPKNIPLYAVRERTPENLVATEDTSSPTEKVIHLAIEGTLTPIPFEPYQPAPQDLAPLTAFTLYKNWSSAIRFYRIRVRNLVDSDPQFMNTFVGDAAGNTGSPLINRLTNIKNLVHQKVQWVDTGLPVYLNPDRSLKEIVNSGMGTSHDMAILLTAALKAARIDAQIYLFRHSTSGDLVPDLPALSQFDGVLVGVPSGGKMIWMDPTEPLAAPGVLPLSDLGRDALAVFSPFQWKTTPPFTANDHRKERDVTMTIDSKGNLTCTVSIQAFGSSELALRQFFRETDNLKRRNLVSQGLAKRFPGAILTDYTYGNYADLTQPLMVNYTFEVPHYAEFNRKGMAFYPLVFEGVEDFFESLDPNRQTPVVIPQNFNSVTRVIVKLPRNYLPGPLPKDFSITNDVAEFLATSRVDFGTLSYERYMGLKKRVIDPGPDYQNLLDFYQSVLNQDQVPFTAVKRH